MRLAEFRVDIFQLEHFVIGDIGFSQQHVHVPRHAARDRMDRVFDVDAFLLQQITHFAQRVLGLGHGHAMAMGLFLLQCADVRIGLNAGAMFQANEVLIGMTLPYFALEALRERVATPHLHLAGTGLAYSGVDAVHAGLLDEAVAPEALAGAVQAQVDRLKKAHPASFTATKQRLRAQVLAALPPAIEKDKADWMRLGAAKA